MPLHRRRVHVDLDSKSFHVQSTSGTYPVVFDWFETLKVSNNYLCLIDSKVYKAYETSKFKKLHKEKVILIDATETAKELSSLSVVYDGLIQRGLRRSGEIVAVGGGITQDIAAFAASTLYRGVAYSFVPTTLLAQADSCIGGKSSINFGKIKNVIGTFHSPHLVLIDTSFLSSLEPMALRSGIGEILKYLILGNNWTAISNLVPILNAPNFPESALSELINICLRIKKDIIEIDEFDQGARRTLNYGHTFGHAIEFASNNTIPHGLAVAMGIGIANRLSTKVWGSLDSRIGQIDFVVDSLIEHRFKESVEFRDFAYAITRDKKHGQGEYNFVLLQPDGLTRLHQFSTCERALEASKEWLEEKRILKL